MNKLTTKQDTDRLDSKRRVMLRNLNYHRKSSTLVRDLTE